MVAKYDRLTNEMQRSCVRLKDELLFSPQKYGKETFFHIEIPSSSKFFRIGYNEYVFASLLDGNTSFASALAITAQTLGANSLNEHQAKQVIDWLLENGLAGFPESDSRIDAKEVEKAKSTLVQKMNPFWLKLPLGNPNNILDSILKYSRWIFHPAMVVISILFIVIGMITAGCIWEEFSGSFDLLANNNWVWMLVGWVALKLVHEVAHGVACRHYGGNVKETGVIFILFAPMAYVDVTSSWRFSSRWQRITVACSGMYVELVLAAACVFLWQATSSDLARLHLFNTFLMASVSTILFNANPLMRFDGYFVLSDLLKIPNLYVNGSKAFKEQMQWLFYGQTSSETCREIENHRTIVGIYGWLASVWRILVCVGLSITASVMFGGLGIVLAAFGVFSWFAKPSLAILKDLSHRRNSKPHSVIRATGVVFTCVLLAAASWFLVPNPFATRAPCVVVYEDAATLRADATGFVSEVLVEDGAQVKEGTLLMRIENSELESSVKELEAKLLEEQTREHMALDQHKASEAQVAAHNQAAIRETLNERRSDLASLAITAPIAGRIVARNLQQMVGRYVVQGDTLLTIGSEANKEVLVSIAPGDVVSTDKLVGKLISFEFGSRQTVMGKIRRITPRASSGVTHESFIAPNGGPLAVVAKEDREPSGETAYQYCDARFHAVAEIPAGTASKLHSGESGNAKLESNSGTLGKFLFGSTKKWIQNQLTMSK